jgi:hypothetical protein
MIFRTLFDFSINYIYRRNQFHMSKNPNFGTANFGPNKRMISRSQWSRGLRHVLSSTTRRLKSWVRILLEAQMCVPAFFFVVLVEALRRADPPYKES